MSHALIIDQNIMFGCELSKRLLALGFDSFDHVWTGDDAVEIANRRPPDLVLIGDRLDTGDALGAVRLICGKHNVPVLILTADTVRPSDKCSKQ